MRDVCPICSYRRSGCRDCVSVSCFFNDSLKERSLETGCCEHIAGDGEYRLGLWGLRCEHTYNFLVVGAGDGEPVGGWP